MNEINMIVIHCTELPDLVSARMMAEKILYPSQTGNCGHFYIGKSGDCYQWVDINRVAHHVRNHNSNSIGIELCHLGRYPHWYHSESQIITTKYPKKQMTALIDLINHLCNKLTCLKYITGHEQLDRSIVTASDNKNASVRRKIDPGPTFPWKKIGGHTSLTFLESANQYE